MTSSEVQMIVAETLRQLGIDPGEITERQARKKYGKRFTEAVAAGLLRPVRVGTGKTATKHYRVTDIVALQNRDYTPARIIYKTH